MIKKELFMERKDGMKLFRRYSLNNVLLQKKGTDELYDEAIDVENTENEYEETDIKIEEEVIEDEENNEEQSI